MERSDLRTLSQRKGYDLLYGKRRRRKFFQDIQAHEIEDISPLTLEGNIEQQQNIDVIEESKNRFEQTQTEPEEPITPPKIQVRHKRTKPKSLETVVDRPNAHDIYNYFTAPMAKPGFGYEKIIGEPNLGVLLTYTLVTNLSWGIEGLPGSSKTLHMKKLLPLIDNPYITSQTTEAALFEDCDKINSADYLIFTELQKAVTKSKSSKVNGIIEVIKDLSEGRDAVLKKVIGNKVDEHTLYAKPVGYSRATTNAWDADRELKRRMIILFTSSDPEQRKAVNESILSNNHKIWSGLVETNELQRRLKDYISNLRNINDVIIYDPYSDCVTDIMPDTVYSTCHIPHYGNMVMASAKFNMYDRLKFKVGDFTYIMTELEDHFTVYNAYHSLFIEVLKELANSEESEIFDHLKEPVWGEWFVKGQDFLQNHPDAEPIRKKLPDFPNQHLEKQLVDDKIMAFNYISGEREEIGQYRRKVQDVHSIYN